MRIFGFDDYLQLGEDIRDRYTRKEWAWLPDSEKQRILSQPTESDLELETEE